MSVSPAMKDILAIADRVATGDAKVLITGESGVGKDLIARYIHHKSPRAEREFVPFNCAAFPEALLESELFGHTRGSFTGAYRDKTGRLELADGGTIFLDEVAEMSMRMQVVLLRFLESGEIQAVGAERPRGRVDARVIAATNRNLMELVAAGTFREDLLYRIQVVHIHVPPLRERVEDIPPLVDHLIRNTGRPVQLTPEALTALKAYRWPGNVRELQNVVDQVVWMTAGGVVDVPDLPQAILAPANRSTAFVIRERRRQLADHLYTGLLNGTLSFWNQIYHLFLSRDITRNDIRELLRKGLITTRGNYRAVVKLFGMDPADYKRFLNFIATHECGIDAKIYKLDRVDGESLTPEPPVHRQLSPIRRLVAPDA